MISVTECRRVVHLSDLTWLTEPGDYTVRGADRTDRARLQRLARKQGMQARTSSDNGMVNVDIRPLP